MPVSLLLEDALQGFGIQSGRHRVVSSDWMVHQFTSKDGKTYEPFVCWAIGYLPVDEKGFAIGEVQIDYSIKVGPKYGEAVDKSKFAPGSAPGSPLPLRLGSKGGYLEPVSDQTGLYKGSKPLLYIESLAKCGFDMKRLAASNFNVGLLVGTEGDVYELVSTNDGTDEAGKQFKPTKIPAFKHIYKFGYDVQQGSAAASAPAGGLHVVGAPTGAAASSNGSGDAEGLALKILQAVIDKNKAKGKIDKADILKLVLSTTSKFDPRPTPADRDAAKALLGSEAFYETDAVQTIAILTGDVVEFA